MGLEFYQIGFWILLVAIICMVTTWRLIKNAPVGFEDENGFHEGITEEQYYRIIGLEDALDELQIDFDDAITRINDLEAKERSLLTTNKKQQEIIKELLGQRKHKEAING